MTLERIEMDKNILIIGDFCYPLFMGGSSKHVYDLMYHFPKHGVNSKLLTRDKRGSNNYHSHDVAAEDTFNEWIREGRVKCIASIKFWNPLYYIQWIRKVDCVILQHPVMGCIGGMIARCMGKKVIYHYHGPIHKEYFLKTQRKGLRYGILWLMQQITCLCSNKVLTHSEYMKRVSQTEHYIPARKSYYLPPYIEGKDINNTLKFFHTPSKINILIPRRLTARTGIIEFLNSFLSIDKDIRQDYHIYISGKGELEKQIKYMANEHSADITYVGFLSYDDLWSFYKQIDAVAVPTLDLEGFGYIILEAMSCGSSVIVSTNCGGGYDFVLSHLGERFTFDVLNPHSILSALKEVSISRTNRARNKMIAKKYSTESMINYYIHNIIDH